MYLCTKISLYSSNHFIFALSCCRASNGRVSLWTVTLVLSVISFTQLFLPSSQNFSQVSLSFTPLSDTISFHCSWKAIVTEALQVGPVFFRPIIERGKKNNVFWDYFRSTLFKNGSIIFLPFRKFRYMQRSHNCCWSEFNHWGDPT